MFLKLFGEKRLVKPVKLLTLSIKSINSIQKYPHITESYTSILKDFVVIVDTLINFLTTFGIFSTLNLSKRNNPMSPNPRILIKIYYTFPIHYFIR